MAWVQFRTIEAVEAASTPDGLASIRMFERFPLKGSARDLRAALRAGLVIARGQDPTGNWRDIERHEWMTLPVAPLNLERQHPYRLIVISTGALVKAFPIKERTKRGGRPTSIDWDWIRQAALREEQMGQNKLADVLMALYTQEFPGNSASRSAIKRKLSEWGISGKK
jgi:hypothetical protein